MKLIFFFLTLFCLLTQPLHAAVLFDGTDDNILITNDVIGTGPMTFCAWIYPQSFTGDPIIFSTDIVSFTDLRINDATGNKLFFSSDGEATGANAATAISLNAWSHVAVVRNSSNQATFYLNGAQDGTANQGAGTPTAGAMGVYIGDLDLTGPFNGLIDDVRIYNRALSATEVLAIASSRLKYFDMTGTSSSPNTGLKCSGVQGASSNQWATPANANCTSDNTRGTEGTNTERQDWYNFGFIIPPDATIDGIDVTVEASGSTASSVTADIDLSWDAGTSFTSTKTATRTSTTDSTTTHGSSSDTWGRTWSAADFSNSNFRLRLTKGGTAGTTFHVDVLEARVYYTSVNSLVGYWPLDDCSDGTSGDAVAFVDRSGMGNNGTGDNGANNTGLTCRDSSYLSYPGGAR